MNLTTKIKIPKAEKSISHNNKIMLLGSCFTQRITNRLAGSGFDVRNPFGAIYNPKSVENSIKILIEQKEYKSADFINIDEKWHSFDFHSDYSHNDLNTCLRNINSSIKDCSLFLKEADIVILSLGTAQYFILKQENRVVANCHRYAANKFEHKMMSLKETIDSLSSIASMLKNKRVIFTVSPIRYLNIGAHKNQISKSTLLMAIDEVCENHPNCQYFPSYEIVMDELRDYRFYESDMVHISQIASDYIWERFSETYFSTDTIKICNEVESIKKMEQHHPSNIESESYIKLLSTIAEKKKFLLNKYGNIKLD